MAGRLGSFTINGGVHRLGKLPAHVKEARSSSADIQRARCSPRHESSEGVGRSWLWLTTPSSERRAPRQGRGLHQEQRHGNPSGTARKKKERRR